MVRSVRMICETTMGLSVLQRTPARSGRGHQHSQSKMKILHVLALIMLPFLSGCLKSIVLAQ